VRVCERERIVIRGRRNERYGTRQRQRQTERERERERQLKTGDEIISRFSL